MKKKSKKAPRSIWLIVETTESQRDSWHCGAAACGYPSLSSFVRAAIADKMAAELPQEMRHG